MWLMTPSPIESHSSASDSGAVYVCRDNQLGSYRSYDEEPMWPYKLRKFRIEVAGMSFGILFGRKFSDMYAFQEGVPYVHIGVEAEALWAAVAHQHSSVQFCRSCDARGGRISDTAIKLRVTVLQRHPEWQ